MKLETIPQIQLAFNEHIRECNSCRLAMQSSGERSLCETGQMLATMLTMKLKRGAKSAAST